MGALIYTFLASLDGYIADEQGTFDWAVPDEEVLEFVNESERGVGTYLYGRAMYEMMTGWELDPAAAAQSPRSAEFAQVWRSARKYVFSRSLPAVHTERTELRREFDPEFVAQLKAAGDRDLNVSGAELAAAAWRHRLIDECQLFVAPILVGGGKPMFPTGVRRSLTLLDERRFGNGMVHLRYAVQH